MLTACGSPACGRSTRCGTDCAAASGRAHLSVLTALEGFFGRDAEPERGADRRPVPAARRRERAQHAAACCEPSRSQRGGQAADSCRSVSKLISLLRAVATGARVLLLDEPAAGVENDLIPRVVDLIRGLVKAEGRATFLVEHNIDLVRQVADQVCVLQGGRIIAAGDVRGVLDDETVIREYLGQVYDA
jgi:ABC-type sugar transport system ATPase subunit